MGVHTIFGRAWDGTIHTSGVVTAGTNVSHPLVPVWRIVAAAEHTHKSTQSTQPAPGCSCDRAASRGLDPVPIAAIARTAAKKGPRHRVGRAGKGAPALKVFNKSASPAVRGWVSVNARVLVGAWRPVVAGRGEGRTGGTHNAVCRTARARSDACGRGGEGQRAPPPCPSTQRCDIRCTRRGRGATARKQQHKHAQHARQGVATQLCRNG